MFSHERGHRLLQGKRAGVSAAQVEEYIGCHINTVTHWNKRYEETMDVKQQIGSDLPSKDTHKTRCCSMP